MKKLLIIAGFCLVAGTVFGAVSSVPATPYMLTNVFKAATPAAAQAALSIGATNMPVNTDQFAIGTGNVLNLKSSAATTNLGVRGPLTFTGGTGTVQSSNQYSNFVFTASDGDLQFYPRAGGNVTAIQGQFTGNGAGLTNVFGIRTNAAGLFVTNNLVVAGKWRWTDGTHSGTIFAPEWHNTEEAILYVNSDAEFNAMGMDLPQPAVAQAQFPDCVLESRFAITFLPTYQGDDVNRYGWAFNNTNFLLGSLSNTVDGVVEAPHVLITHDFSNAVTFGAAYLTNIYRGKSITMESSNRLNFVTQRGVWIFNPSDRLVPVAQIETNGDFRFAGQLVMDLAWGPSTVNAAATSLKVGDAVEIGSVGAAADSGFADVSCYGDARFRKVYVGSSYGDVTIGNTLAIDDAGKMYPSDGLTTNVTAGAVVLHFESGILKSVTVP